MSHLPCVFDLFYFHEAIAASALCHQRNAIFGRGAGIFVLTHFPCVSGTHRIACGAKRWRGRENSFPPAVSDSNQTGLTAKFLMPGLVPGIHVLAT
jgi:hypothetical protein